MPIAATPTAVDEVKAAEATLAAAQRHEQDLQRQIDALVGQGVSPAPWLAWGEKTASQEKLAELLPELRSARDNTAALGEALRRRKIDRRNQAVLTHTPKQKALIGEIGNTLKRLLSLWEELWAVEKLLRDAGADVPKRPQPAQIKTFFPDKLLRLLK
jgi:hypothetical protein